MTRYTFKFTLDNQSRFFVNSCGYQKAYKGFTREVEGRRFHITFEGLDQWNIHSDVYTVGTRHMTMPNCSMLYPEFKRIIRKHKIYTQRLEVENIRKVGKIERQKKEKANNKLENLLLDQRIFKMIHVLARLYIDAKDLEGHKAFKESLPTDKQEKYEVLKQAFFTKNVPVEIEEVLLGNDIIAIRHLHVKNIYNQIIGKVNRNSCG